MIPLPFAPPHPGLSQRLGRGRLTRRDALWLLGVSAGASALASMSGCATSPVTGERILVGMSEDNERAVDQQAAPHQFSQDLGAVQDAGVNQYVSQVGKALHSQSHRAGMPYSYRVLNANYVNAYTFPAGSVGITRGIMTEMQSEAELAALLGHELGHVNARHAAQRQGQAMVGQAALVGIGIAASDSSWGGLAMMAGQIGASALLSSDPEGVGGALVQGEGAVPSQNGTMVYLNGGDDLAPILARVERAGGQVAVPKTEIGNGFGFFAHFVDTEGNKVGLHSMN